MTAARPAHHAPDSRLDLINSLAAHLLQYPEDLVDASRLLKTFPVSAHEFQHVLLSTQQEDSTPVAQPVPHAPSVRRDGGKGLAAHLLQYPQDLVDAKRLLKAFPMSTDEFQQILSRVDSNSRGD
jgi:hypothetical protein